MAFIDTYTFHARAGRGGDGVVRWRREKFVPKGGPAGGNGGRGGDFMLRAVHDINRLSKLVHTTRFSAQDGEPGGSQSCTGKNGEPYALELPVGSVITEQNSGRVVELLREGEEVTVLHGGEGGLGNEHFKGPSNQTPMQCTQGKPGEEADFSVELKLIADVGLVGLPNAGKTSLLNALTRAGAKVGDYPFTTLDPNLGSYHGSILADIPGLIEGASNGKGLGHKFLRHITRTRVILHCISLERDTMQNDYETVRKEILSYEALDKKEEYVVLTKSDVIDTETAIQLAETFSRSTHARILATVSILDDRSLKELGDRLTDILRV